ncbi:glycoside hydrolase family 2 TIM barrel-domain containing protein [Neobacillus sp. 179-C4.2 HS]|uniref:Glycoside hydrolase family 2 TIM barrel-domain containing protein n=1 Tax=Neobacillus driksii TaxID=3035913 RepID=A0ABV4Z1S7_9BACI|nr:glycoside hydrolase family 2 TIM barrel-domain containing protein [Neobacillus sp. 179.-C4.2 HS]MDP5195202.1 glycoside hydrolase family 2 TIM barrel-domain containing protein [Neobacillus sp. 179.-C4.2 HS]
MLRKFTKLGIGILLLSSTLITGGASAITNTPVADREPMNTQVKSIDGTNVLYQYGEPVPSFDTWTQEEQSRNYLSLDGKWKFAMDPNNQGMTEKWYQKDYDDSNWQQEKVPGSWDLYDTPGFGTYDGSNFGEGTAFYDGDAWFRTHFSPDDSWKNQFVKLNFLGVNYRAWVYINGHFVGEHEGGNTPFALNVSEYLQPGKDNVIAVRVHRRADFDSYTSPDAKPVTNDVELPYKPVDYWRYAGITRSVYLEATSNVNVSKILTATGDHTLTTKVVVYNHGDKKVDRQLVVDPGEQTGGKPKSQEIELNPGEVKVVSMDFDIKSASYWTPESPTLYEVTATLYKGKGEGQVSQNGIGSVDDSLSTTYGMRTIATEGSKLTLNGEQVFLKGLNWHEETAANGKSMTIEEYDTELNHVLNVNANFIRNSHYNRHPYVYDFADKHGLMVLDDVDNMWLDTKQEALQTNSYGLSRALVLSMAWNQINRPSVIMWSLQNESQIWDDQQVYRDWLSDMKSAVKSVDIQNRPVTWASGSSWDPAYDLADVIGLNEYFGYFYMKDEDLGTTLEAVHRNHPNKPILITENGTWAYAEEELKHGEPTTSGTEEWQSAKFLNHWNQVTDSNRLDYMAGYTFWVLKDYKQRLGYNQQINGISTMGLMRFDNEEPRLVYETFKNAANPFK